VDFTYSQLVSIYYQLKNHGELRWAFTTFREYNFNKYRWHLYHKSAITINSIKNSLLLLDSLEARELLIDFIFSKMDELKIMYNNQTVSIYQTAFIKAPNHWYLEKIKGMAILHYEAAHFGIIKDSVINNNMERIFTKQPAFIKDLQNKKIL